MISQCQTGFRNLHSTITALTKLHNDLLPSFNRRCYSGVACLDFRKAFDTVDHSILLNKIKLFGISCPPHTRRLHSYLSNRTQSVNFNGVISTPMSVTVGIPQGSILGPLLFLLFINDLPSVVSYSYVNFFADDTFLSYSDNNFDYINNNMNLDLANINKWAETNKLILNTEKSRSILFSTSRLLSILYTQNFGLILNNITLPRVNEIKILGVIFDHTLSFKSHVSVLCKQICKSLD